MANTAQIFLSNKYIGKVIACADPEGDRVSGPPGKSQNIGFLSNTDPDPLKQHKATKLGHHHLNGVSLADRSWPAFCGICTKYLGVLIHIWRRETGLKLHSQ